MFGILQAQAPAKQTATDTIQTLSGRLLSATLLEDRRAAILGLRSFAKQYPASVASGALRGLIGSLGKDVEDVDTVKVVLETLLTLFSPDETSPEASDDIALWLADEFTQRQDNITILLDLLDTHDFYSRLYSLQLLAAVLSARPERTQECVFTAPLGISRLVAILDDRRDVIRNEGLLLLTSLTPSSPELQKLVAFENAFDRIFSLITAEGSLSQGGIVIQDCLSLLANLLRLNVSNQSFFRETGCVPKLAVLIGDAVCEQDDEEGVPAWAKPQRDKNLWGVLAVVRLFLVRGGLGTHQNQTAFWSSGILSHVLQLAFSPTADLAVRAEALTTCADLIRGNAKLQEGFAQLQVPAETIPPPTPNPAATNGVGKIYVIDGLVELTLVTPSTYAFDTRLAACECIKAYFYHHPPIRLYFLKHAIQGYISEADDAANVLSTLLTPDPAGPVDPYRPWFAAVLLLHLLQDDGETKALAMGITEGDAASGEEVVTMIQALTGQLIAGLQRGQDDRVSVAYLMLLCAWLFEDPDAVNDFLGEGSSVQSLVHAILQARDGPIVQGLCAVLLGIVYEFSTKDSPIPRAMLHPILSTRLGREQYIDKIARLREHPWLRDYEVLHQGLDAAHPGKLPEVYFDKTFVDFLKDHFSRLTRAVDRDPGMEVPVLANGVHKGISRELVDSLRTQLEDKNQVQQRLEQDVLTLERKLGQEQADHRRAKETGAVELQRLRTVNEGLQRHHEDDLTAVRAEHQRVVDGLERQLRQVRDEADATAARVRERNEAEVADLRRTITQLEGALEKATREHLQDLQTANEEYTSKSAALDARAARAEAKSAESVAWAKRTADSLQQAEQRAHQAEADVAAKEEARSTVQTELDDLLMVLGDIEEKRSRDK
ncbi:MAG: hypothetical protein M1838_005313, partial [Thelocarpon superellum]